MGLLQRFLHREPAQETPCPRCGAATPADAVECEACGWDPREAYHEATSGADREPLR